MRMKWKVALEQEADGGYVVTVPALPGCVSQGDTLDEALANIREAIEGYILVMNEEAKAPPESTGFVEVEV